MEVYPPLRPPIVAILEAVHASRKSPCRSKRGASAWMPFTTEVLASGYNAKPEAFACTSDAHCKATCAKFAIHAEQSALLALGPYARGADMLHVKTVEGHLAVSGPPSCVECSKLILQAGISGMWLYHVAGWTRYDAEEFHRLSVAHVEANIKTPGASC
ncbi:MAG: cytidine/deoxycytidylate deaminase family protein [Vulcanimicrobiaceae bacterium]